MSSLTVPHKSASLLALEEKVLTYLSQMGLVVMHSDDDIYLFKYGSTVVMVSLFEEENDTYVRFASTLLKDFEMSIELMTRLLRLNNEVLFGAFLLFEDNTISFAATLLGEHLDFEELAKTLRYVARISDDYDDSLQKIAGGKKAIDILSEEDEAF
ncbi:MAG: T3SS (YopN, CesT) and YbjN peptide-binding chaperone 1 [Myxococcota bacterium]